MPLEEIRFYPMSKRHRVAYYAVEVEMTFKHWREGLAWASHDAGQIKVLLVKEYGKKKLFQPHSAC